MTKANSSWEFRGVNLAQEGWYVRALGASEQVPARRGENLVVPGRIGRYQTGNKPLDERRLSLAMQVESQPAGGGVRSGSTLWANLETLKAAFAQDGIGTLKHQNAQGTTRLATAEVINTVEFDPGGPDHYAFVVEFAMADPFWYAEAAGTTTQSISMDPQNVTVNNPGTYRAVKPVYRIVGPATNPKLAVGSTWVQYTGSVANGGTLTIDCGAYTATNGTADVSGDITHDGDLVWLPLAVGVNSVACTGMTGGTFVAVFTAAYI
jgi:hypothetical protein